ncbi:jg18160 [Pararge aegeria aegeria]|uniref:Jg18160 protein n=1 Tax=Pararge aegeria aegeria TaxID=348720 RepID=A0A8S4SKE9_9NEOP|nr:jg18160 [Pararge aegeria aegeria]
MRYQISSTLLILIDTNNNIYNKQRNGACWCASEWGSARKSLNTTARRSEGIVGLRAPHVRPNLGSGDDWSERVTDGD